MANCERFLNCGVNRPQVLILGNKLVLIRLANSCAGLFQLKYSNKHEMRKMLVVTSRIRVVKIKLEDAHQDSLLTVYRPNLRGYT